VGRWVGGRWARCDETYMTRRPSVLLSCEALFVPLLLLHCATPGDQPRLAPILLRLALSGSAGSAHSLRQ
jgi:hypothetical protein